MNVFDLIPDDLFPDDELIEDNPEEDDETYFERRKKEAARRTTQRKIAAFEPVMSLLPQRYVPLEKRDSAYAIEDISLREQIETLIHDGKTFEYVWGEIIAAHNTPYHLSILADVIDETDSKVIAKSLVEILFRVFTSQIK